MLVELVEVTDAHGLVLGGKVYVNPEHVQLVRRAPTANPDTQSFVTEVTVAGVGPLRVTGAAHEVRKALAGGGR